MPPVEFEPKNTAGERPQTYATAIGKENIHRFKIGSQEKKRQLSRNFCT
jgi:hypothetical protein